MAERFVSAGTGEDPPDRDDEWLAAQRELDENALRKKAESAAAGSGLQDGGKTLYEVLQANKAAKQEAFEENAKLKNQFRSLDEDEIDFLDAVLESTRKKEEEIQKETTAQLDAFRRQREEAERIAREADQREDDPTRDEAQAWAASGRKRRKKEKEGFRGLKLRKTSSADITDAKDEVTNSKPAKALATKAVPAVASPDAPKESTGKSNGPAVVKKPPTTSPPKGLGLVTYSSDED